MQSRRYHAWPNTRPQSTIGTASADLMMSRVLACKTAQPQDEYTAATDSLFAVIGSSFPSEVKHLFAAGAANTDTTAGTLKARGMIGFPPAAPKKRFSTQENLSVPIAPGVHTRLW